MSVHLTEEEQLEILKRWWKEYGRTVLLAILIAVGGYFAIVGWQNQQLAEKEAASNLYEDLLNVVNVQPGQELGEAEKTTAAHLANQLKEKNSKSLYAHNAAFFLAKLAVLGGNMDQAATELKWVLANKPELGTEQIARLRLARILIEQSSFDEAEKLLANPADAFKGEVSEARGDILVARGDLDAALVAYDQALADTDPQHQERVMLLQLKRDDLKVATTDSVAQISAETIQ